LLEGFADKLCQTGYAESRARAHIRAAEHFIYWTHRKAIAVATPNDSVIDGFLGAPSSLPIPTLWIYPSDIAELKGTDA